MNLMSLFESLGFSWNREILSQTPTVFSVERVLFHFYRSLPEFVWNAGALEGNPFTFIEVKTLLDGVTVGGRKVSDAEQILNLADSSKLLIDLVQNGRFSLSKEVFCALHAVVARNEALEWGHFRGEGRIWDYSPCVTLGPEERYVPLATQREAPELNARFQAGVRALNQDVSDPFERALAFFLFGALHQFFFDGNKRTSRLMMNGELLRSGFNAINIPFAEAQTFNRLMVDFYRSKEATPMMHFLISLYQANR
jgi:Fic family protein